MKNNLDNSPQIWSCHIGETDYEQDAPIPPRWLSTSERSRYTKITSHKRKIQFIQSRHLLRRALSHNFSKPIDWWVIEERQQAPPLVKNIPQDIKISLSHSNNWVILAIGTLSLGVDIEKKKYRNFVQSSKIFMTEKELASFQMNPSNSDFYRTWCLKEAFYKAFPSQQNSLIFEKIETTNILNHKDSTVFESESSEYQLTLYVDGKVEFVDYFDLQNQEIFSPAKSTGQ